MRRLRTDWLQKHWQPGGVLTQIKHAKQQQTNESEDVLIWPRRRLQCGGRHVCVLKQRMSPWEHVRASFIHL
jgi:hypothetical protein